MSMMMLINIHNIIKKMGYILLYERGYLSDLEAERSAKEMDFINYDIISIESRYYIVRKVEE